MEALSAGKWCQGAEFPGRESMAVPPKRKATVGWLDGHDEWCPCKGCRSEDLLLF